MLRYQPPKANVWGHSLRKMKPSIEIARAREFERRAVGSCQFATSSLMIAKLVSGPNEPLPLSVIKFFEDELKVASRLGYFRFDEAEFERALNLLIKHESAGQEFPAFIILSRVVEITAWKINGTDVPTTSNMHWAFGTQPDISTFLTFNDRAEYEFIRQVLMELEICTLNEKHLRAV